MDLLQKSDKEVFSALMHEEIRQSEGIELIPSENYCFPEVYPLLGSVFNNKYSEGYPGRRYYGGQENTDTIETLARERAKKVFRAEHANVQPLSGCPMNEAVYFALLEPKDTILGMDLSHGGHLSHGHPVTNMYKIFNFVRYKTEIPSGNINLEHVRAMAKEHKPKMIICGHSSYPKEYDYAGFRKIADEAGAILMADVSHLGGLIAGGALKNPLDFGFDVVTTTTHKSLRGPRGGMILCKEKFAKAIDKSVFPGMQGGPHMHQIAALATTLKLVQTEDYKQYAKQVLANAQALAKGLIAGGAHLVTGGTENHLIVINTFTGFGITGDIAEKSLDEAGITLNKNMIPDDPNTPMKPSGIRFGTPAATARGMKEKEMDFLSKIMIQVLKSPHDAALLKSLHAEVKELCKKFPVPGIKG
ncbi:MAG: serine hydroxymethyltransferase [Alphaproteobacteria bacterium]|nr:serine hydroxymethyltransferase [Alphaproteobacteria bacterium]MCL2504826.1 serine hydroxymethyltransferase [Alphaproteobacteria bacterium]